MSTSLGKRLAHVERELTTALILRDWPRAHELRKEAQGIRDRMYEALRPNSIREEACVVRTPESVEQRFRERWEQNWRRYERKEFA